MKYLKSTSEDLKNLFTHGITVNYIAESFRSFDYTADAMTVHRFMKEKEYDVVGIRKNGKIVGYVEQNELNKGHLMDHLKRFKNTDIIPYTTSLTSVFKSFRQKNRLFIESFNDVNGIVTKGDLQKHPVRLWLFGIISLVEMQMLRIIRDYCPGESWKEYLNNTRKEHIMDIYNKRVERNQHIDPNECLEFCDKKTIILKNKKIFDGFNGLTKSGTKKLLEETEDIRNELAHSQDYLVGDWPNIFNTVEELFKFLKKCEKINYNISS